MINIKRIYEKPEKADGYRVLVDRLWPRGVKKEKADVDFWAKEVAPSTELRKWFNHIPAKWNEFKKKYKEELKGNTAVEQIKEIISKHSTITFLYAAKDEEHNQAIVLKEFFN